ncbi:MAG: response regulator [Pyrinomonadaceae bacterium]
MADEKRLRIIIAEDSNVVRKLLTALLSKIEKVEIIGVAPDGEVALRLIRGLKPDVIILDIEMPYLSGLEVLKEVRKHEDDSTVVIIFTSDEAYRDECLINGANFFLDKVTEFKLLIDILENDLLAD